MFNSKREARFTAIGVILLLVVALFVAIPEYVKNHRLTASNYSCINVLRQIDGAKEQWVLENKKSIGSPVDSTGVLAYMIGGKVLPCPEGGTYSFNPVGVAPSCSISGHVLP
jgi:hypothetical protein